MIKQKALTTTLSSLKRSILQRTKPLSVLQLRKRLSSNNIIPFRVFKPPALIAITIFNPTLLIPEIPLRTQDSVSEWLRSRPRYIATGNGTTKEHVNGPPLGEKGSVKMRVLAILRANIKGMNLPMIGARLGAKARATMRLHLAPTCRVFATHSSRSSIALRLHSSTTCTNLTHFRIWAANLPKRN